MTVRRAKRNRNYTKISNAVAQDNTLSLEAKGVWLDIITRPEDWKILPKYMAKQYGIGRDKMYRILNELIEHKLCHRKQMRKKNECGRYVAADMEYVVYDEPSDWEKDYHDPDIQDPENQETHGTDTTKNRVLDKEQREEQQPREAPDSGEKTPLVSVVVPSFLSEVEGLSPGDAAKLANGEDEDCLREKVKVLQQAGYVENPYGFLRRALDEDWHPKSAPAVEAVPENRAWARKALDGVQLGPNIRIDALNEALEFVYIGGAKAPDVFSYEIQGFKEIVGAHCKDIRERLQGR